MSDTLQTQICEELKVRPKHLNPEEGRQQSLTVWGVQLVSFKWLARHYGIPAATAKQHLARFAQAHSQQVKVTYLLAGLTKEQPARHVVLLVPGELLKQRRDGMDTETALHVYSLQPAQLKAGQPR